MLSETIVYKSQTPTDRIQPEKLGVRQRILPFGTHSSKEGKQILVGADRSKKAQKKWKMCRSRRFQVRLTIRFLIFS